MAFGSSPLADLPACPRSASTSISDSLRLTSLPTLRLRRYDSTKPEFPGPDLRLGLAGRFGLSRLGGCLWPGCWKRQKDALDKTGETQTCRYNSRYMLQRCAKTNTQSCLGPKTPDSKAFQKVHQHQRKLPSCPYTSERKAK